MQQVEIKTIQDEIGLNKEITDGGLKGLYNMPEEVYHNSPGYSNSKIKSFLQNPKLYEYYIDIKFKPNKSMELGSLVDMMITQPERFKSEYHIIKSFVDGKKIDRRSKVYKDLPEDGRKKIFDHELGTAQQMEYNLMSHPMSKQLLNVQDCYTQLCCYATDDDMLKRGMLDYISGDGSYIVDIKTTKDASIYGWYKMNKEYKYYMQCAWYLHLFGKYFRNLKTFYFVTIENVPPYECAWYQLQAEDIERSFKIVNDGCKKLHQATITGKFENYSQKVNLPALPEWVFKDDTILVETSF